jgi:hypothetical protein
MKTERFNSLQELEYSGKLEAKQFANKSKVVKYEHLSAVQNELYKRCLIGLDFYSPQELYNMNSAKKSKIFNKHKNVQSLLNLWKQEITIEKTNAWLSVIFPKSQLISDICNDKSISKKFINTLSFKELGINKEQVIDKLIDNNFLPKNFASL